MERQRPSKRLQLEVGGMTCPSCEHHVEQALREYRMPIQGMTCADCERHVVAA